MEIDFCLGERSGVYEELDHNRNHKSQHDNNCLLVGVIKIVSKTKNLSTSEEVLRFNSVWRADVNENNNWEVSIIIDG